MNIPARSSRGIPRQPFVCWAALLLTGVAALGQNQPEPQPYDSVDPFIGTTAGGNTFPGATLPFGMIQWGPDTRADGWYHYEDHSIRGFSLTHLSGAGCPIFADVPMLPWIGKLAGPGSPREFVLPFSHDHEQAKPGCYAVEFDNGVKAELTVAARTGIGRFVFPPGVDRTLLIKSSDSAAGDPPHIPAGLSMVEIRGPDLVVGKVHSGGFCTSKSDYILYFAFEFPLPFASFGTWTDTVSPGSTVATGPKAGAYVSFAPGSDPIAVKVGLSFVSIENAQENLAAEIPGWDFAAVRAAAHARWAGVLALLNTEGGTTAQRAIFYTGVYHMLLAPNLFSDANGDYLGFDGKVRRLPANEAQYANFSDWYIYRNVTPLHALLFPDMTGQMMQSLVRDAEQSGWLPRWPVANDVSYIMGGDSPAILLAEAYAWGTRSFDAPTALSFVLKGATQPGIGPHGQSQRPGLADYLAKGYIPVSTDSESAGSVTLEYQSADFAISRFAAALGDHANARELLRSSRNWRTLFDGETGFIRPRTADGKFLGNWDPDHLMPRHQSWDKDDQLGFEEGSTWQYTWMIPHDYAGLFAAMGGKENAIRKLDAFFSHLSGWGVPTFTVTNEPDFCAPYAYLWTGCPWKTQEVVDRIRRETFGTKPDGLPGNDDLGATSGVYVWNALGMYPVVPGIGGVGLGTPMFPRAVIRMGNGRTLEILAQGRGIYVQSVMLNGRPWTSPWLPLDALAAGSNRIEFALGPKPNAAWGTRPADLPPSFADSATP